MATLPLSQEGATVVHPGIRAGTHLPTSHMPWTQEPWLLWTPVLGRRRCRRCGLARALHWFRTPACGPSVSSVEAGAPLQLPHPTQPVPMPVPISKVFPTLKSVQSLVAVSATFNAYINTRIKEI